MLKLVEAWSSDKEPVIKRRQMPVAIYDDLTMIIDFNSMGLICDNRQVKGREYEEFLRTYRVLSQDGIKQALRVTSNDIVNVLNESIPCVGCRKSVERLFQQLVKSGHPTLDPLVITPEGVLTIRDDKITNFQCLATLMHGHDTNLEILVETQQRWKRSRRCALHSLDAAGRGAAWGGGVDGWRVAWVNMRGVARERIATIPFCALQDTLHAYLRKHRFCHECKTKVLHAYQLLTEATEPHKEKGFVQSLYAGIKRCGGESKHLHISCKTDFVADLLARAEPELLGGHRERHAKTMEYAQEEVIICLGVCLFERLQRVWSRAREEESSAQLLAASAVAALHRSLALAADKATPRAMHILELEANRERTREQKKLRKRKRKARLAIMKNEEPCDCEECVPKQECECEGECECKGDSKDGSESEKEDCECAEDEGCECQPSVMQVGGVVGKREQWSCSELSQDCGYASRGGGSASPISSASSDASCCKIQLSLQQMLQESVSSEEEEGASYIPLEEVLEFRSRKRDLDAERLRLREKLRDRFAAMCTKNAQH